VESDDATADVEPPVSRGGAETILVVEDEESILELARESLELLGYTVLTAGTPEIAIQLAKEQAVDLLITDVVMPRMNGRQLAEHLTTFHPGLKCLYMSGFTADIITGHQGIINEGMKFLAKPFSLVVLAETVREAIDG
jgi:DNA-binding NtrC family response regulator